MVDGEDRRLSREVEDLQLRMRAVENVQSPAQSRAFEELQRVVRKVEDMDVNGTHATRLWMVERSKDIARLEALLDRVEADLAKDIGAIATEVQKWDDDKKALRNSFKIAVIGVVMSLCAQVILFVIQQAAARPGP